MEKGVRKSRPKHLGDHEETSGTAPVTVNLLRDSSQNNGLVFSPSKVPKAKGREKQRTEGTRRKKLQLQTGFEPKITRNGPQANDQHRLEARLCRVKIRLNHIKDLASPCNANAATHFAVNKWQFEFPSCIPAGDRAFHNVRKWYFNNTERCF